MGHLVRRFFQSLSRRVPDDAETADLRVLMTTNEYELWKSMSASDQRHSLMVVKRFRQRLPDATPDEIVGVALHDVGKVESRLGTIGRVVATVVGPRTKRFASYHEHERIGQRLLRAGGSSSAVLALLDGSARRAALDAFRWADDC